jgi:hypothetical protein
MRHPLIAEYAYPISKGGLDAETLRRRAKFTVDGNYGGGHDKSTGGTRVGQLLVAMTGGRQG